MCSCGSSATLNRRSLLGAALAGSCAAIGTSLAAPAAAVAQIPPVFGTPRRPILPVLPSQPIGPCITQLGTSGGPQAEYVRTGTSTVLTVGGKNYVIDCGRSSVTQYLNAGLRFRALEAMFITHLHADHLADYYNYFLLEGGQPNTEFDNLAGAKTGSPPLKVWGPGPAGALPPQPIPPPPVFEPDNPTPGIVDLTNRMNEAFAYSYNVFIRGDGYVDPTLYQDVREIEVPDVGASPIGDTAPPMDPFTIWEDDRVSVSAILVPHGWVYPSFAYRFDYDGGAVAFSGDTKASDNVVRIAQGADVLVHEILDLDFFKKIGLSGPLLEQLTSSHTTTEQVGPIAEQAEVPQLVLTHLIPSNPALIPDFVWERKCKAGYSGTVTVGNDLNRILLPV